MKTCVYALKRASVIVYIGRSESPYKRAISHMKRGLSFDGIEILIQDLEYIEAARVETELIIKHNPEYNKTPRSTGGYSRGSEKSIRVNMSISPVLHKRAREFARLSHSNFSAIVTSALLKFIDEKP